MERWGGWSVWATGTGLVIVGMMLGGDCARRETMQEMKDLHAENVELRLERDAVIDFIQLVVDDVEDSVHRTAAVLSSTSLMIEAVKTQATPAPGPHVTTRSGQPYGVNDFPTACVGPRCYVQIDGVWKQLPEARP